MVMECTLCEFRGDVVSLFRHSVQQHKVFSCVRCATSHKFSKQLMVHLYREHKMPPQRFKDAGEFVLGGGTNVTLLCVECNEILELDELSGNELLRSHDCKRKRASPKKLVEQTVAPLEEDEEGETALGEDFKIDPLLQEKDAQKRLDMLIDELVDKLGYSWPGPDMCGYTYHDPTASVNSFDLVLDYNVEDLSEDDVLNEMLRVAFPHCGYCRQTRLVKIDKRQLAIHLFSRHSWNLRLQDTKSVLVMKSSADDEATLSTVHSNSDSIKESSELSAGVVIKEEDEQLSKSDGVDVKSNGDECKGEETESSRHNDDKDDQTDSAEMTSLPKVNGSNSPTESEVDALTPKAAVYDEDSSTLEGSNAHSENEMSVAPALGDSSLPSETTNGQLVDDEQKAGPCNLTIDWTQFKITVLGKVFHSKNVLFSYRDSDSKAFGEIPCECLLCGFVVDCQKNLFSHWRKVHRGVAMKCAMCQGCFLFAGALFSHLCLGTPNPVIKNEGSPWQLSGGKNTPSTLPDSNGLNGEFSVVDMKEDDGSADTIVLRYQCNICKDLHLPGFFNYMIHLRKEHNRCELCLDESKSQKDLEHHMKKHKLNHFCWKCGVTYVAKPNFMTHLFWKHGSESKECSFCLEKKWPHIYHYCVPPVSFTCDSCGACFRKPKSLVVHRRLHTGEKMRKCPKRNCLEKFISKKLLEKHIDVVHNVNPIVNQEIKAVTETCVAPAVKSTEESVKAEPNAVEEESGEVQTESAPENLESEAMKTEVEADKPEAESTQSDPNSAKTELEMNGVCSPQGEINESGDVSSKLATDGEEKMETKETEQMIDVSKSGDVPEAMEVDTEDGSKVVAQTTPETIPNDLGKSSPIETNHDQTSAVEEEPKVTEKEHDKDSTNVAEEVPTIPQDMEPTDHTTTERSKGSTTDDENVTVAEEKTNGVCESTPQIDEVLKDDAGTSPELLNDVTSAIDTLLTDKEEAEDKKLDVVEKEITTLSSENPKLSENSSSEEKPGDCVVLTAVNGISSPGSVPNVTESITTNIQVAQDLTLSDDDSDGGPSLSSMDCSEDSKDRSYERNEQPTDEDTSSVANLLDQCETLEKNLNQGAMEEESNKKTGDESSNLTPTVVDMDTENDLMEDVEKLTTAPASFGSMSPLLPPLDDFNFNVPNIPTFEDNVMPEHIIRENAMFSISHEHDYCLRSPVKQLNAKPIGWNSKRGHEVHSGSSSPKKLKVMKPKKHSSKAKSPKKRHRSPSSSSSSSSSCGSGCSCSTSSSSSSSSSEESTNEAESTQASSVHTPLPSPAGTPIKRGRGRPKGSVNRNKDGIPTAKKKALSNRRGQPRGASAEAKRKYRKTKGKFCKKSDAEADDAGLDVSNNFHESDLETEDSGSEDMYYHKQLMESIGMVPAFDEIWTMSNEMYLLKVVRGVREYGDLLPTVRRRTATHVTL